MAGVKILLPHPLSQLPTPAPKVSRHPHWAVSSRDCSLPVAQCGRDSETCETQAPQRVTWAETFLETSETFQTFPSLCPSEDSELIVV